MREFFRGCVIAIANEQRPGDKPGMFVYRRLKSSRVLAHPV
jgi:hypothetical protein